MSEDLVDGKSTLIEVRRKIIDLMALQAKFQA